MKEFDRAKNVLGWIKNLHGEDKSWVIKYLSERGLAFNPASNEFQNSVFDNAETREIDRNLKNAWRQRKARKNMIEKKAYNFVLNKSTKKKLDYIATSMHCSLTDALDLLIREDKLRFEKHKLEIKEIRVRQNKKEEKIKKDLCDLNQSKLAIERELGYVLMQLALTQIPEQNLASQHLSADHKKELVEAEFIKLWERSRENMRFFGAGMAHYHVVFDHSWSRLNAES